jgi:hypothetical protein
MFQSIAIANFSIERHDIRRGCFRDFFSWLLQIAVVLLVSVGNSLQNGYVHSAQSLRQSAHASLTKLRSEYNNPTPQAVSLLRSNAIHQVTVFSMHFVAVINLSVCMPLKYLMEITDFSLTCNHERV